MIKSKTTLNKDDLEIIQERGNLFEFYVLHFDVVEGTSDFSEVEFKPFLKALGQYNADKPKSKNDRVELIFSPEDEDYGDNMMLLCKMM